MHLVKEGKFMDKIEATLLTESDKYSIQINSEPKIIIPISDDNANAVKSAFNKLIEQLQKGKFSISLTDQEDKGLFYYVANEYIEQLNGELSDVYDNMEQYGFIEKPE